MLPGRIAASCGSALDYSAWSTCGCCAAREGRSVQASDSDRRETGGAQISVVVAKIPSLQLTAPYRSKTPQFPLGFGRDEGPLEERTETGFSYTARSLYAEFLE